MNMCKDEVQMGCLDARESQASNKAIGSDFSLVLSDWDYDPFADIDDEEDEESLAASAQRGPCEDVRDQALQADSAAQDCGRSLEDLFTSMKTRRRILLAILRFLDTPQKAEAVNAYVAELQQYDTAVYTGYDYLALLEQAQGIDKVNDDGTPFDESLEQLPNKVELDGEWFWSPTDGRQVYWLISEAGREYAAQDDPYAKLCELAQADAQYARIYRGVLVLCAQEGGASSEQLNELVTSDDLSRNPFKHYSYFAKKLEDCAALEWRGYWCVTAIGNAAIEEEIFGSHEMGQA